MPVLVSVFVYITYYILDNSGYRMARGGMWTIWFGKSLAPAVLIPMAIFFTVKASNDSMVFNIDLYREMFRRFFGLRVKRHVYRKEVIINDPDYASDAERLERISAEVETYSHQHRLKTAPNWVKVFFKYEPDHEIERINNELETVIEDLGNTRDRVILGALNQYPIMSVKAHTRPFERKWLNIVAAAVFPVGLALYFRMWRFRLRLMRDLKVIAEANATITNRIKEKYSGAAQ